jgi:hypothetical protein
MEFIILNAYFLALPLPPVQLEALNLANENYQEAMGGATRSLVAKGYLQIENNTPQSDRVLPALAQHLRDMVYGNEMLHLFILQKNRKSRQAVFYHHEGRFIKQAVSDDGCHKISLSSDIGRSAVMRILNNAVDGERGDKVLLPLEGWNDLLATREVNIEEDVLAGLKNMKDRPEDGRSARRLRFIEDVLAAKYVLVLTVIKDRLNHKQEKAAFVLGKIENWLVVEPGNLEEEEKIVTGLKVPKVSLRLAVESLVDSLAKAFLQNESKRA